MSEDWNPHHNGFIKHHIGVFPGIDAWEVWDNFSGEWAQSEPFTYAARKGRDYQKDRDPPYRFWERSREETIEECKRLAEEWLRRKQAA